MFPIDIDFSRLKEVLTYDPQAPMIFSSGMFNPLAVCRLYDRIHLVAA